jgi:hypothetical protein
MNICITYISKATKQMLEADLDALLQECISWNKAHGITGMLLYIQSEMLEHKEGRFIQALEGKKKVVQETFAKIKTDHRHFDVTVLSEIPLSSRNFSKWSMGFKSLNEKEFMESPGRFELNPDFLKYSSASNLNPALDFIKQFYSLNLSFKHNKDNH